MVMCEWMLADIKNRASNKAFSKVTILGLDIERQKLDLKNGNIGGITYEEAENILEVCQEIVDLKEILIDFGYEL